ncbi:antitermination protein Q [Erwinia rhapontici]|uniref:antiterminator Q family protein n=1 Tax=Erwinia rhapontici TaxID=55212 RepID=UPI0014382733|nr:antiterminator Q family protein [Erwinia rhapontici]NKG32101.1 antitermination protein Q [Erwinia rhapontici]
MRDIQMVLERWGAWSRHRYEMGYSPIAAGFKGLLPESPSALTCTDSDAMIVDACVGRLKAKKPDEHALLEDHYIKGISKRQIARQYRLSEGMIRIQMQMAEGFVEGCLSMLDITLEMDSYTQKKTIQEPVK